MTAWVPSLRPALPRGLDFDAVLALVALAALLIDPLVTHQVAGASGFLLKGAEPAVLIEAVRTVARGDALLEPGATRRLIEAYVHANRAPVTKLALPGSLTSRELEILALIAGGLTNSEIAARLFISPLTCKSHVSRILTKLDARDRTQLVVIAYESGLVVPGRPHAPGIPG